MKRSTFAVIVACVLLLALCAFPRTALAETSACPSSSNGAPIQSGESAKPLPAAAEHSRLVSEFSTSFDMSASGRSYNVALAASNFCYLRVEQGERLSFNQVVGARTQERGYRAAKVIENGEYVVGVGGGVCQVSTTLYNAWIRAGLGVESVRAHSLPSSYCKMSQDATVSDMIDLVLVNDGDGCVYIDSRVDGGVLTFRIYGTPRAERYEFCTEVEQTIPPDREIIEFVPSLGGKDHEVVRAARNGYRTRLVKSTYRDGKLVSRETVRRDVYLAVPAKILVAENIE